MGGVAAFAFSMQNPVVLTLSPNEVRTLSDVLRLVSGAPNAPPVSACACGGCAVLSEIELVRVFDGVAVRDVLDRLTRPPPAKVSAP